jgi:outer membrane receptor for ferrienterochelin and colicins
VTRTWILLLATLCWPQLLHAQEPQGTLTIRAVVGDAPVAGARVRTGTIRAATDERGEAVLRLLAGEHTVRLEAAGLRTATLTVRVRAGADTRVVVELEAEAYEGEEIIVMATRTGRRIEDEPIRVEVVGREEIEEKLLMTPGDIAMLLNETAGLRVQPTAPTLGGAGVRIQGLRGRYAQILTDGLPLHGGQTGALGPLQIPPMDLAQVEVIKGAASALYGASALGGVVNLVSRRPADEREAEVLLNRSTHGGTDGIVWNSGPLGGAAGYTLLAGAHHQRARDVSGDGWADVPGFRRLAVRPRFFHDDGHGRSAMLTAGVMVEDREGGTVRGGTTPAGSRYEEALTTQRFDAGVVSGMLLGQATFFSVRGSLALQRQRHRFDDIRDDDEHRTGFAEAAVSSAVGPHGWVAGVAIQRDEYAADQLPAFDYTHTVPGAFVQGDVVPAEWLSISASARVDRHSRYGTFASPRVSALLRPGAEWTVRLSAGTGWFGPTPWTDETEAVGLRRVVPPAALVAERAGSASIDVGRALGGLELNATAFASRISDAVQVRITGDGRLELFNATGDVRTHGTELLARYHDHGLHITATHVFLSATEPDPDGRARREVPLTPRHSAGLVAAREWEGAGRVAVELYYTGRQQLEDNPYRAVSEPHVVTGFLVERRIGPARVFLNAENILDTRQTRYDPLLRPSRSRAGRWTTDVWAPLEGRSFNVGIRWAF